MRPTSLYCNEDELLGLTGFINKCYGCDGPFCRTGKAKQGVCCKSKGARICDEHRDRGKGEIKSRSGALVGKCHVAYCKACWNEKLRALK